MLDSSTQNPLFGISILIPVYNYDINPLLDKLVISNFQNVEIIVLDDASTEKFNVKKNHSSIIYKTLTQNVGRSVIRNLLANEARFSHLLYLDCDVIPQNQDFIKIYLEYISTHKILSGGTIYSENPPLDTNFLLHWKAGRYKEQKPVELRNMQAFQSFTLNNLLISKEIYLRILLDESLTSYGHEDTKFGIMLEKHNFQILHIDNPVYHLGLNSNYKFIEKSLSAVDNLCKLIKSENIGANTKLYKTYQILKKYYLIAVFKTFLKQFKTLIYNNLNSKNPKLFYFDLIKLNRMIDNFSK